MKLIALALAASLFIAAPRASAVDALAVDVLTFQDNGPITLNGLGIAVLGQMEADPGPGGLPSALTFTLNLPLGPALSQPVVGDLRLLEPGGAVADIVRFNPGMSMVFYSTAKPGVPPRLADTGLPAALYANTAQVFEGQMYLPGPGDPGFALNLASGRPLAYLAVNTAPVPEPATLPMLLAGVALLRWLGASAAQRRPD